MVHYMSWNTFVKEQDQAHKQKTKQEFIRCLIAFEPGAEHNESRQKVIVQDQIFDLQVVSEDHEQGRDLLIDKIESYLQDIINTQDQTLIDNLIVQPLLKYYGKDRERPKLPPQVVNKIIKMSDPYRDDRYTSTAQ